jgi:hypothetical protein
VTGDDRHPGFRASTLVVPSLHNQSALAIKGALLFRRGIVVVDVPFHLPA